MGKGTGNVKRRALVIGLDCVPPELLFEQFRPDMPNISALIDRSTHGRLKSAIPPITVPAWASMTTSKDPGRLGFYGFRNRTDTSYQKMGIVNSQMVREPAVWDLVSRAGGKVVVMGVPPAYPPKPVNGVSVGCFLTPSVEGNYTYPANLKWEIQDEVGEYLVDVPNFRTEEKDRLLSDIYRMTERRFALARHFMDTREWDFFMMVEMGTDRIHHGFWHFMDPEHPKYEPGRLTDAIHEYYKTIDAEVGSLLSRVDDDTAILLVSDHGAKRMEGGVCINEWLIKEGLLTLKSKPAGSVPLEQCEIDWSKTVAWASGGYYSRVFLNVAGREPNGIVTDYQGTLRDLKARIEAIPDHLGRPMPTTAHIPDETYETVRGFAPDLIVLFGDLLWRAVGSVDGGQIYTFDNDTGPDDANHAQHGVFVLDHDRESRWAEGHQLMDIAPTLLDVMGLPVPSDMQGRSIVTSLSD
ncbi:MAG: alkaline phosphatase family protein [Chloroflexota bacterium]